MPLPPDIARCIDLLTQRVLQGSLRQTTIAQATGVDQSQVSRILSGKTRRVSRNVLKLCNYAKSLTPPPAIDDGGTEQALLEQLRRIVSGNPDRAEALKRLLLAVEQLHTSTGAPHAEQSADTATRPDA